MARRRTDPLGKKRRANKKSNPKVTFDKARFRTLIDAAIAGGTTAAEIATGAKDTKQNLVALRGSTRRTERARLKEYARVLNTTVEFLEGDPSALPPGLEAAQRAAFERYMETRIPGYGATVARARRVGSKPAVTVPAAWELEVVRALEKLEAVLPSRPSLFGTMRIDDTAQVLDPETWRQLLRPDLRRDPMRPEDAAAFARVASSALSIILRPFTDSEEKVSAEGPRLIALLLRVVQGLLFRTLVHAQVKTTTNPTQVLGILVAELTAEVDRISDPYDRAT
jgi:hypothetical protein